MERWLKRNIYAAGREWCYKHIRPRIVVEELLEEQSNNKDNGINDYKFLCFYGEPKYVVLIVDRFNNSVKNIYDEHWNFINVSIDHYNNANCFPKPEGFFEMYEIAKTLSRDFPFVRVDLYYVKGKVYFGELTFYPWAGYVQFNPDVFDFVLGKDFILPS